MKEIINCMPGPVNIFDEAKTAYVETFINHRQSEFISLFEDLESDLKKLTKAEGVIITTGSGTTANFMMLSHLKKMGSGMIISNGEFGDRLIEMAKGLELDFVEVRFKKYQEIDNSIIDLYLDKSVVSWVVLCYIETSTGISNKDCIEFLKTKNVFICADCISAIGNERVDMSKFYLASASSGKGLGSYAGLSLLFYGYCGGLHSLNPKNLPTTVTTYLANQIPYTLNCNLVLALAASLKQILKDPESHYTYVIWAGEKLRNIFHINRVRVLNPKGCLYIVNVVSKESNLQTAEQVLCDRRHVYTNYASKYLRHENTIQFCLMGDVDKIDLDKLNSIIKHEVSSFVLRGS